MTREKLFKVFLYSLVGFLIVFFVVPLIPTTLWAFSEKWPGESLVPTEYGFKWFKLLLDSGALVGPLTLSLIIGITVVTLSALLSLPAAYVVGTKQFRGRELVISLLMLPLIVPPVATGVGLLGYFTNLGLKSNIWAVIFAHMIGATPYMFRSLVANFEAIDPSLEEAARVLGATTLKVFIHVYLPLVTPGLLAGTIFAFSWSINEYLLTALVGLPDIITIPVQIFRYVGGYYIAIGPVSALSVVLLIPSIIFLILTEKYVRTEFIAGAGIKG